MSQIKLLHSGGNGVNISAPDTNPSSDRTVKLPSTDADGTITTKDSDNQLQQVVGVNGGQLSHRNIIVNGAMTVAQRTTSVTSLANGYKAVDRYRHTSTGLDAGPTHEQADISSGTTPYTLGFRKSYKLTNGDQSSGSGADDRFQITYAIEAQDISTSGWNYLSSSSFITLSFWCKSSVAQNFYGFVNSSDGTEQSFPFQTGSLSADTWTKVTVKIPGNSNIQIDNDNDTGLKIFWDLFEGTNLTDSGVSLNQWGAYSATAKTPDQTSTWYTTNDSTFELTGVQLEVGDTATSFEHRSYADELRRCQRYYVRDGDDKYHYNASSATVEHIELPVQMRADPTIDLESVPGSGSVNRSRVNWFTVTSMGTSSGNIRYSAEAEL